MPKPRLALLAAAASLSGLVSCDPPPPPPPPRFTPNPPYAPMPVEPGGAGYDVSPPAYSGNQPPPSQPDPAASGVPGDYPTARPTTNPNEVLSPYEPYNVIDISGPPRFKSGQLARDPSNQKIFRVP